jgi:protein gp37
MAENSKIEWTDHTFNPWIGCTKVSPGCDHCYAERREDKRLHRVLWGPGQPRQRTKTWGDPVRWNKQHEAFFAAHGRRQRVFCASLADVFDNEIDPAWRDELLGLIATTPNLDWLLLTKRIGNVSTMVKGDAWAHLPHVWLGATVVNQAEADRDVPKLLAVPARVRFLSIEPMLGAIELRERGYFNYCERDGTHVLRPPLHWIIAGGESGPHARPVHPDWIRSLRDQCKAAGVPFHFKQWGEWWEVDSDSRDEETGDHLVIDVPSIEATEWFDPKTDRLVAPDGRVFASLDELPEDLRCRHMTRLGKKAAGRLLDGVEHNGFPT